MAVQTFRKSGDPVKIIVQRTVSKESEKDHVNAGKETKDVMLQTNMDLPSPKCPDLYDSAYTYMSWRYEVHIFRVVSEIQ